MTAAPRSGRGGLPHGRTFRTGTRAVFAVLVPGVGTFFKGGIIKRFFFSSLASESSARLGAKSLGVQTNESSLMDSWEVFL